MLGGEQKCVFSTMYYSLMICQHSISPLLVLRRFICAAHHVAPKTVIRKANASMEHHFLCLECMIIIHALHEEV